MSIRQQLTLLHRGLTCKLLWLLPVRHMVRLIRELVGNRSFTLTASNNKWSRLRRLKNSVPLGSVLAPLLFNIYVSDLSITVSRKNAHADLQYHAYRWRFANRGRIAEPNMATIGKYLKAWKLKLSTTKTVSAIFNLNEVKRELKVNFNNEAVAFCSEPKHLGVTLDRTLTYRRNHESLCKKPNHASHSWGGLLVPTRVLEQQRYEQPP